MDDEPSSRLTLSPNVISFDCGISNLAYCFLTMSASGKPNILKWENVNLRSMGNIKLAIESLVNFLDDNPWMLDVDAVAVEQQTMANTRMKVISHALQTYFISKNRRIRVHFVSPKSKFKCCGTKRFEINVKTNYRRNKKLAEEMTKYLIGDSTELMDYFCRQKKKDDLADSFLQGLYFLMERRQVMSRGRTLQSLLSNEMIVTDPDKPPEEEMNEDVDPSEEVQLPLTYESVNYQSKLFVLPNRSNDDVIVATFKRPRTLDDR